jgi:GGDEF domain-containing protein
MVWATAVGDEMLTEVARRISSRCCARRIRRRALAVMSLWPSLRRHRVVISTSVLSLVRRRGEELRSSIEAPMNLSGNQLHVTVSIGVSLLPA